jgi:transposase
VGIDSARYGQRVSFLRPERPAAAQPWTVRESRAGDPALPERLEQWHQQPPQAPFHVRSDAAGPYAAHREPFLRGLPLPLTLSIGEPKRNQDYQKAHSPKRTTGDTESQALARCAVVERPTATTPLAPARTIPREVAGRLQAKVQPSTQAIHRLHHLLARVFPERANRTGDRTASWVLRLLDQYPTAHRLARARLGTLHKIPYRTPERAGPIHLVAQPAVAGWSGDVAETLVRARAAPVHHTQRAEDQRRRLRSGAYAARPASPHLHVVSVPGLGVATAAALLARAAGSNRFDTPERLVGFVGIFPEENTSGVAKFGNPLPPGAQRRSRKGNDLVRPYLWNAARCAIRHHPALGALYRRLQAKGQRGDVARGHGLRKLLPWVYAVWKTHGPFDANHFAGETPSAAAQATAAVSAPAADKDQTQPGAVPTSAPAAHHNESEGNAANLATAPAPNETAVGHQRDGPAQEVVPTANATVASSPPPVQPPPANRPARPKVDCTFLRQQVTLEQVLRHLGLLDTLRGRGLPRRGPCPIHGQPGNAQPTFSAHFGKQIFQCFHGACRAQGNVLDLWAALHRLPLYDAALHLAETFHLPRNREEEPVSATR